MESLAPPDFDPSDRDLKPILHEEIGRLPSKHRDAIVLYHLEGLTMEVAAQRIGRPASTLERRLVEGTELLRNRLTRRGLTGSVLHLLMGSLTVEAPASLPDSLLDDTVSANSNRPGGRLSRRVASMVLREESSHGRIWIAFTWGLLASLLLIPGASRMALGRKVEAPPRATLVDASQAVPPADFAPAPVSPSRLLSGVHCEETREAR